MRQKRWLELVKDYDCTINYHPGKANAVADEKRTNAVGRMEADETEKEDLECISLGRKKTALHTSCRDPYKTSLTRGKSYIAGH